MTKTLLEKARETNNEESLNKNMEVETFLRENVDNLFTDADSYNFWVRDRKNLEHLLCGIYLSAESDLSEFDEITQYFTKVVTNKKNTRVDIIKQCTNSVYSDGYLVLLYVINNFVMIDIEKNPGYSFYVLEFEQAMNFFLEEKLEINTKAIEEGLKQYKEANLF